MNQEQQEQALAKLRELIEGVIERKMKTPKDFEYLSECIFEKFHEKISPTTLKRLWGYLSESTTPRKSTLDIGAAALDNVTMAIGERHQVSLGEQNVMGIRVPTLALSSREAAMPFGVGGTSADTDVALRRFTDLVPLLIELAEIGNAVLRLARELRKTQRRCNALNRIFIPEYKATTDYITASLEERERENFVILRMVKERLAKTTEGETTDVVRQ